MIVKKNSKILKASDINWDSDKVKQFLYGKDVKISQNLPDPFFEKKVGFRKSNLSFTVTDEEFQEICKCANDVIYFAEKYCVTMQDEGISNIKLRSYQKRVLKDLQNNRYNVWLAPRQIGKCVTFDTSIEIIQEGNKMKLYFYEIYYNELKKWRKLKFFEKVKIFLYKSYLKMDFHHSKEI